MKINKQLFEDVLSGKLKGTFVLRDKREISSNKLTRNNSYYSETHPYTLMNGVTYTSSGLASLFNCKSYTDIIDFIPDTNMKENELKIEIPDGKIVDWDESKKQNKIVFKNKQLTYEDICKNTKIGSITNMHYFSDDQMRCLLAKNQLVNVAKYLNNGWKPGKTDAGHFDAWVLFITPDKDFIGYVKIDNCACNSNALFKSKELAQQAIEILGEETVKLALEPLGV